MTSSRIDIRPTYLRGCSPFRSTRLLLCVGGLALVSVPGAAAQAPDSASTQPLPNITTLLIQVGVNQRRAEAIRKDYTYLLDARQEELNGDGSVKKTETSQEEIFWLNGVPVNRTLRKNGKALTPDELARQNERIDKEVAKAKARREGKEGDGKETDARGNELISVNRFLALGTFSHERRVQVNGRPTIALDYAGDPRAKTNNIGEGVIRNLAGTVWIDEQDVEIQHVDAMFATSFKIAGGLVANISQGTHILFTARKINDEVWLPASFEGHGHARVLLFFNFNGNSFATFHDYRKFKTSSTILPGVTVVAPDAPEPATPAPNPK